MNSRTEISSVPLMLPKALAFNTFALARRARNGTQCHVTTFFSRNSGGPRNETFSASRMSLLKKINKELFVESH